jgi:hypothetical protein
MLSQELDRETERYLADILAQEKTTTDALIRQLIRDRWLSLYPQRATSTEEPHTEEPQKAASPQTDLPPTQLTQSNVQSNSVTIGAQQPRPKNSKQLIADFVRRKNGRSF